MSREDETGDECPMCAWRHIPENTDSPNLAGHRQTHFYGDDSSDPVLCEGLRRLAVPHAWPMRFGDPTYRMRDGESHDLAIGMDDEYVYFGIVTTDLTRIPLHHPIVRMDRATATWLGELLVCDNRARSVCKDYEHSIRRMLEQLQADPDADLDEYARRIYHHVADTE